MQSSQLLPPPPAGPADVAATLPAGRESAPDAGEGSFGVVLESRMNAAAAPEAAAGPDGDASEAPLEGSVQAPGDAVLASLIASLAGAAAMPQSSAADAAVRAGESATVPDVAAGPVPSRNRSADTTLRADPAPDPGAAPAGAATGADPQAFARLLPAASGASSEPVLALATPLESTGRAQAPDLAAGRAVPDAAPRVDALPPTLAGAGDAPAESAPPVRVPVPAGFGSAGWNGAFADRVTWIAQARQPSAELTLNPPQLGPVEVRVSVSADQQATLSFHSPHPAVREAIQGSLPRLQEAFAASGLLLGDVFVGSGAAGFGRDQSTGRDSSGEPGRRSGAPAGPGAVPAAAPVSWLRAGSLGQVDLFA